MIQIIKNRTTIYWQWVLNQPTPPREWRVGWVGWRWERSLSASRSGKRSRSRCSRRRTQMRRLGITTQSCCSAHKVNLFQQKKEELRVKAAQELADWWGLDWDCYGGQIWLFGGTVTFWGFVPTESGVNSIKTSKELQMLDPVYSMSWYHSRIIVPSEEQSA